MVADDWVGQAWRQGRRRNLKFTVLYNHSSCSQQLHNQGLLIDTMLLAPAPDLE